MANSIHPTAIIDPTSRLGDNVTVGPFTIIGPECMLGDGCVIGDSVAIHKWTELCSGCQFWHGASIGSETQDLKYRGARTRVVIGQKTVVREFATVTLSTLEESASFPRRGIVKPPSFLTRQKCSDINITKLIGMMLICKA